MLSPPESKLPQVALWQLFLQSDTHATFECCRVAVEIVKLLRELGDWEGLNSHIVLISKRRQQLKQVLVDMVQVGIYVELSFNSEISNVSHGINMFPTG